MLIEQIISFPTPISYVSNNVTKQKYLHASELMVSPVKGVNTHVISKWVPFGAFFNAIELSPRIPTTTRMRKEKERRVKTVGGALYTIDWQGVGGRGGTGPGEVYAEIEDRRCRTEWCQSR